MSSTGERKIVVFSIGARAFGIDMRTLIEIREWDEPTPLPKVPSYIRGVSNLRGNVIPIVDLSERLGWSPSAIHARSCVLVVTVEGKMAGFLVDEVADIVAIEESQIQPAPDIDIAEPNLIAGLVSISSRAVNGEGRRGMVSLLDLDSLTITRPLDLAA